MKNQYQLIVLTQLNKIVLYDNTHMIFEANADDAPSYSDALRKLADQYTSDVQELTKSVNDVAAELIIAKEKLGKKD